MRKVVAGVQLGLVVALLAAAGLPVPVGAQAAGGGAPVATDPVGDPVAAGAAPWPSETYPSADLTAFWVTANAAAIDLGFQVVDLATARPLVDSSIYRAEFAFDGSRYSVGVDRNVPLLVTEGVVYQASLVRFDDGFGYWRHVTDLAFVADTATNIVTVTVPLQKLVDPTGLPVRNGSHLADLVVAAVHGQDRIAGGGTMLPFPPPANELPAPVPMLVLDRLPDAGVLDYLVQLPITGGQVLLDSPNPVRATNGGPGTFVYPVRATNAGTAVALVDLALEGLPAGWGASLVDARMELQPGESRITNAVVKPPFGHAHGTSTNITVRATLDGEPSDSAVVLQLVYSDPAQPAGHHPRLYLHSANTRDLAGLYATALEPTLGWNTRLAYMNTAEQDDLDTGGPVNVDYDPEGALWRIPLSPALGMGLDFDTTGAGHLAASFASTSALAIEDARFTAQLLIESVAGDTVLAESAESEPLAVQDGTPVELVLAMLPAADYVPFGPSTNLVLQVRVQFTEPGARLGFTSLDLLPGGWLDLPLLEYQDEIPLQELGGLSIEATPAQAKANPGDTVVFDVRLTNGGESVDVVAEALDVSAGHILDVRPSRLRVPSGGSADFRVEVRVAEEAVEGELFNVFVAVRPDDAATASLVRLTTLVTTTEDVASAADGPAKESPTVGLVGGLAALALVLLVRRRRA